MYKLIYFVHHSRVNRIKSILDYSPLKDGHPVTITSHELTNYVTQEIKFDSIEKVNSFIYRGYMNFGVYFLVVELTKC